MYRFRKPKHLIEYSELENQEIYFSDLSSLNDPMEGFRQYYWKGDKIVWKNFFKHYILCLEQTILITRVSEPNHNFSFDDIPVFTNFNILPTPKYKEIIKELYDSVFSTAKIEEFISIISHKDLYASKDEVYFYLRTLHLVSLNAITKIHIKHGFRKKTKDEPPDLTQIYSTLVDAFNTIPKESNNYRSQMQIFFNIARSIFHQFDLSAATQNHDFSLGNKEYFIFSEFPSAYLEAILKLTYPETHVSCFIDNCINPVIWSHYGDNHKGVALKFKTIKKEDVQFLELNGIIGLSSRDEYINNKGHYELKKVKYSDDYPEINFFQSLGSISVGILAKEWFSDNNQKSEIYDVILAKDNSIWREEHWKIYMQSFFQKLTNWEYENEYRIVLADSLGLYSEKANRKFTYEFNSLEGIVFGLRTPIQTKKRIIEIIEKKCKKADRKDFKFYQIEFDSQKKQMKEVELKLIKFN